jgi:lysophospholipase L1-like esterase
MSELVWSQGQMIIFAGDSITDCGRRDVAAPYGNGYVRQTIDLIAARYPDRGLRYVNAGISGNTVQDLKNRWHDDVLRHQPDWITVKIGINDCNRVLSNGPGPVPPILYEKYYRDILLRAREAGAQLVLIDPFYISADTHEDSYRTKMLHFLQEYLAVVEHLAHEFDALHVHTHNLFQEQLKHRPADSMSPEPVHPNSSGHLVIAHGLLQILGW